ncbi:alpha/beta hydrolase family protein [Shewanella colwelliana]|uniref:alpha/beta hydrolase family protein n=1 Tax=Shewanella colwelliana TaxID=23 RepID=UPI003736373E
MILPHGGPHVRDYWGFDPIVQMLANKGYAVIQVNFRGSTGYGKNFEKAGYGNWGTKIQDDIMLATQYAVQQGVADEDRMCIFGISFGGYSALQSAVRFPDTFKCSIGYAGVYDLEMLYNEGDVQSFSWGDAYLDETLGSDKSVQRAQSPVHFVSKLKAPVLIIHGEDDERAPIEHAEALRDALNKGSHPYEWLVKDKEGHGFYKEDNILEANQKILTFLDKYIGH